MARCLAPRTIKDPCTSVGTRHGVYVAASRYARDNIIRRSYNTIVVPCGKCLNCLKNKQSSMAVRCKREAEKRGSFAFMTLTYDDDHLPITQSLWRVSKDTGEMELFYQPEFISSGMHPCQQYCDFFKTIEPDRVARYHEFSLPFPDSEYDYMVRMTPSVCRSDVQEWLKMSRIQFERDFGKKLPDFSYVAISEYGPRTCRPHYHLAFFGLQREHLEYLLDRWHFGKVKQVKIVAQINKDRSNGFVRASRYIGKYMSKGKFECDSVTDCAAQRPRVCQSKGLGTKDLEPIRRQVLCFDMFGEYDPETLLKYDFTPLTRLEVDMLVKEIPKRLVYRIGDGPKDYVPLPRIIRDKIFKCVPNEEYETQRAQGKFPAKMVSSALWCMVTASLRDELACRGEQEFRAFLALHPERTDSENCLEFAYWQEFCAGLEERVMSENLQDFYRHSHF